MVGNQKLDAIKSEDVQRIKTALRTRSPKTVNNVLTVLNTLLRKSIEWNVIERMPCTIRLLPVQKLTMAFHDFDEYERLLAAATAIDAQARLVVLLGGDAGLRCGEIIALEWADVDLSKRMLCVRRSEWKGEITAPKNGRFRYVPLTNRLTTSLRDHRHLRGPRVICEDDGSALTRQKVQYRMKRAARRANLTHLGFQLSTEDDAGAFARSDHRRSANKTAESFQPVSPHAGSATV